MAAFGKSACESRNYGIEGVALSVDDRFGLSAVTRCYLDIAQAMDHGAAPPHNRYEPFLTNAARRTKVCNGKQDQKISVFVVGKKRLRG